jgi:hypothetical protein
MIGTSSRISDQLRAMYSICRWCWNVATYKWKVHNGNICYSTKWNPAGSSIHLVQIRIPISNSRYWDIQICIRKIRNITKFLVGSRILLEIIYIYFSSWLHWTSKKTQSMEKKCSYQYFMISVWFVLLHQFLTPFSASKHFKNCSVLLNR